MEEGRVAPPDDMPTRCRSPPDWLFARGMGSMGRLARASLEFGFFKISAPRLPPRRSRDEGLELSPPRLPVESLCLGPSGSELRPRLAPGLSKDMPPLDPGTKVKSQRGQRLKVIAHLSRPE